MITHDHDLSNLLQRLERLERTVRDLARARVVEATELRLVDEKGRTGAVLAVGEAGPYITYPDPRGHSCTELLASEDWREPREPVSAHFEPARAHAWSDK